MAYTFNPFTGTLDKKLVIEGTTSELSGNIALNGNYISNDGGDEGLKVTDDGIVRTSGELEVNGDLDLQVSGTIISTYGTNRSTDTSKNTDTTF